MVEKQLTVLTALGLHARASARLVSLALTFDSTVELTRGNNTVDAKSMLGVMTLALTQHSTLTVRANGQDEAEAIDRIEALFAHRFGEDQ